MRLNHYRSAPGAIQAMVGLENYLAKQLGDELDKGLLELIKLRVSQLNGCAYCIDMHARLAREYGESEQRLHLLCAWHETALFTAREKAALAWAEANTRLIEGPVDDELYQEVSRHFGDKALVDLTLAVAAINAWNRFGVSFLPELGSPPGP
ncbi:carboxymuconolactone decarboxylase family protein [Gallaecimonas sp. GXIMD4217]|uniref:carboxymuconolactone decarboxylase family protein n=1 Tax=Gallaecimonas sp. GXIMD4217 TaxID=3131927 RepID=UPI00311AF214